MLWEAKHHYWLSSIEYIEYSIFIFAYNIRINSAGWTSWFFRVDVFNPFDWSKITETFLSLVVTDTENAFVQMTIEQVVGTAVSGHRTFNSVLFS